MEHLEDRLHNLIQAEEIILRSSMTRTERACRKATRDAYLLVLDLIRNDK